ncbi:MAG TPA: hypothetical protein EYG78_01670 [Sulfurovum sp.]|nr:hypothetical protein [Sulfurovum sp.]
MNQFYKNAHSRHSGPDPESLRESIVLLKAKEILNQVQDDVRNQFDNNIRHSGPDPESLQDSIVILKAKEILNQVQDDVKKQVQDEVYTF